MFDVFLYVKRRLFNFFKSKSPPLSIREGLCIECCNYEAEITVPEVLAITSSIRSSDPIETDLPVFSTK